jgi:hypothetical protein
MVDTLPTDQEATLFPEVVRTKTFFLTPMTVEEALIQVRSSFRICCAPRLGGLVAGVMC